MDTSPTGVVCLLPYKQEAVMSNKVGGFTVRGIELCLLSEESAVMARENGEVVYNNLSDAQAAVSAALRGVCDSMHIPTAYVL